MKSFSATDAAFAGFRLMRERPRVILAWAVFFLLASVVNTAILIATGAGTGLAALQALTASGNEDPGAVMAAFSNLGPAFLILLAISLAFDSIILAAAYRAYLRPADKAHGAFRFGADEARMAALLTFMFLVWVAYLFVVAFAFALLVELGGSLGGPIQALLELIGALAMMAALAYPWVRLSLAAPITLDSGKVVLLRSWRLTHGHFWRLFWTYMLTTAVLALVALLSLIVIAGVLTFVALITGQGMAGLQAMTHPDLTSFAGYFNLGALVSMVLNALMSAALLAIWAGPTAEIYRVMKAADPDAFAKALQ